MNNGWDESKRLWRREGVTVKVHHRETALGDYNKVPFICEGRGSHVAASGTCLLLITYVNADRSSTFCRWTRSLNTYNRSEIMYESISFEWIERQLNDFDYV